MSSITIEEAKLHFSEIIDALAPGEEVVILRDQRPVAKLVSELAKARTGRQPGCLKDSILFMSDDFDAPLEEFREYME